MTRRQYALRLLMIAVLAICAWAWWSGSAKAPPPTAAVPALSENAPAPAASGADESRSDDTRPASAPLPPVNAPIDAIAATLQRRADAADSRAACRLAAELIRCRQVAQVVAMYDLEKSPLPDTLASQGKLDEAIAVDELRLEKYELHRQCAALPEHLIARAGEYLAQAADAGEPEAMILYLEGQHFPESRMGLLGDPGFQAWYRDTPAMAQALMQLGHPEAAFILALAYSDDLTAFGGLVRDDLLLSEAYRLLVQRLAGTAGRSRPSTLGAEDQLRARALAEDWHARYFENRQFEKSDITRRLTLMGLRRPDSGPAPCEP